MIKKLLLFAVISAFCFTSCKKNSTLNPPKEETSSTGDLVVPTGFNWESSRNINFIVSIYDAKFQGVIHVVSIYNGDPLNGGVLITKGSATTIAAFRCKLYLSNQIKEVYLVSTSPDNTKVTKKVTVGADDIDVLLGEQ
jgi:hypothetical protein